MAEQPGTSDVHVNALLTNISVGYHNRIYISRELFPEVLVLKQSDIIPAYRKSDWFRLAAKKLTEREAPPIGGYNVETTDTYFCDEWGIGHFISDRRRANVDLPFNADRDGTRWLTDRMELSHEYEFVSNFWKAGVWANDKTGAVDFTKWSVLATSTPILDIRGFRRTIRRDLGGWSPNVFALGDLTFDTLCDHPDFLDRIKYGSDSNSPAMVTPNLIAQLLGFEKVPIGVSLYTADVEGTAEGSVTYTPMWDDDALMLFVPKRPSLFTPAAGYKFTWRTALGGPRFVRKRRDPLSDKGDLIEAFEYFDQKAVATPAGLFVSDAVD